MDKRSKGPGEIIPFPGSGQKLESNNEGRNNIGRTLQEFYASLAKHTAVFRTQKAKWAKIASDPNFNFINYQKYERQMEAKELHIAQKFSVEQEALFKDWKNLDRYIFNFAADVRNRWLNKIAELKEDHKNVINNDLGKQLTILREGLLHLGGIEYANVPTALEKIEDFLDYFDNLLPQST